ncbi:MAG: hypothetical protein OXI87_18715 [Albidovulum sp.]|nr:hypothetical protein [Albidovulum sp.]
MSRIAANTKCESPFDLNLEPIMVKAIDEEEGYGWSLQFTKKVALEYQRYLLLCQENSQEPLVPSSFVDDFWHLHILDTIKYADDCNRIFGEFLHHFPYFGMRGKGDEQNLANAWTKTLLLYESRFGSKAPSMIWPKSQRCPNCGRRCKDMPSREMMANERPTLASLGIDFSDERVMQA